MCKSRAEGGRRCAGHLRDGLNRALAAHAANPTPDTLAAADDALANYAATAGGREDVAAMRNEAEANNQRANAARLTQALRNGHAIRAGYDAAEDAIKRRYEHAKGGVRIAARAAEARQTPETVDAYEAELVRLAKTPRGLAEMRAARAAAVPGSAHYSAYDSVIRQATGQRDFTAETSRRPITGHRTPDALDTMHARQVHRATQARNRAILHANTASITRPSGVRDLYPDRAAAERNLRHYPDGSTIADETPDTIDAYSEPAYA